MVVAAVMKKLKPQTRMVEKPKEYISKLGKLENGMKKYPQKWKNPEKVGKYQKKLKNPKKLGKYSKKVEKSWKIWKISKIVENPENFGK